MFLIIEQPNSIELIRYIKNTGSDLGFVGTPINRIQFINISHGCSKVSSNLRGEVILYPSMAAAEPLKQRFTRENPNYLYEIMSEDRWDSLITKYLEKMSSCHKYLLYEDL